jgi:hypothetical protein
MIEERTFSARSTVKRKLLSEYKIQINKPNFYRGVCAYNDNIGHRKNFTEMIDVLNEDEREMSRFAKYLLRYAE